MDEVRRRGCEKGIENTGGVGKEERKKRRERVIEEDTIAIGRRPTDGRATREFEEKEKEQKKKRRKKRKETLSTQ